MSAGNVHERSHEYAVVWRTGDGPTAKLRETGTAVITHPDLRWQRCDIKSTNLLANVLANTTAAEKNASEALLYLASVSARGRRHVEHLVVKLDRINERARTSEIERHRLASSQAPPAFATRNMARLAYEVESEGAIALFYTVAGQSLQQFRTLASEERQSRLEALFAATTDYLLRVWNAESTFEQAVHPQRLLEKWLGYRLKPDGEIASFLRETFRLGPDTEGFLIEGQVFPNPLSYGFDAGRNQSHDLVMKQLAIAGMIFIPDHKVDR